jgi:hypothetical protein
VNGLETFLEEYDLLPYESIESVRVQSSSVAEVPAPATGSSTSSERSAAKVATASILSILAVSLVAAVVARKVAKKKNAGSSEDDTSFCDCDESDLANTAEPTLGSDCA